MSVLDEVGTYIVDNVSGMTFALGLGTTVFIGRRTPDSPGACVGLVEYSGRKPEYSHSSEGLMWERPRVQVFVRDANQAGAYQNVIAYAYTLYNKLATVANQALSGTLYLRIEPQQSPFEMGPDAKDRPVYGFNIECWRRKT